MKTQSWLVVVALAAIIGFLVPALILGLFEREVSEALTVSIYFLITGFIAFNFEPRITRVYVLLLWLGLVGGLLVTGHDDQMGALPVLGVSALVGAEFLCRSVSSIRSTAVTDPLTGLLNRIGLINESARAIAICRRLDQPLSLVHIDLDDFKEVNDREGHARGDEILRQCAESWAGATRQGDILARIGGDEFLLVLPGSNSDDARQLTGVLKEVSPIDWSYGVAQLAPGEELQACVVRADAELYTNKSAGT